MESKHFIQATHIGAHMTLPSRAHTALYSCHFFTVGLPVLSWSLASSHSSIHSPFHFFFLIGKESLLTRPPFFNAAPSFAPAGFAAVSSTSASDGCSEV